MRPRHYVVHATYDGGDERRLPVDVAAGAEAPVDVTPHVVGAAASRPRPSRDTTRGILGPSTLPISISLLGAGAVAGGFSIALGVARWTRSPSSKQTGYTSQDAHDHAPSLRDCTNVMFVTALVLGAAGIAALVTVHRVKVRASVGLGSLTLSGSF